MLTGGISGVVASSVLIFIEILPWANESTPFPYLPRLILHAIAAFFVIGVVAAGTLVVSLSESDEKIAKDVESAKASLSAWVLSAEMAASSEHPRPV